MIFSNLRIIVYFINLRLYYITLLMRRKNHTYIIILVLLSINIQYVFGQQMPQPIAHALGGIDVVFTYGEEHWDGPETTIEVSDPRGLSDAYGWEVFYEYPTMQVIHLNGADALAVARTRNSHGGYGALQGNFSREYFQQKIIEATVKKARETNFVTDLGAATGLLNAVGDNIRTTFSYMNKCLLKDYILLLFQYNYVQPPVHVAVFPNQVDLYLNGTLLFLWL